MTWRGWKLPALIIAAVLAYLLLMLFSPVTNQVANESLQYQLKAIGESIYEYHNLSGQWPTHINDLERTSLSTRLRNWRQIVENGSIVIVFNNHLNPNPANNRDAVLAYHNKGTLAMAGQQWVCWGDLRTEYVSSEKLKAALQAGK